MAKPKVFKVGDRVKFTNDFLNNTGMRTPFGRKVFTVIKVTDWYVVTDEPAKGNFYSPEQLAANPDLGFIRIHPANIRKVK